MIRFFLFVLALAAGTAAIWVYLQQPAPDAPAPEPDAFAPAAEPEVLSVPEPKRVVVLGARSGLVEGQEVTESDLAWIDWPEDNILSQFIMQEIEPDAPERLGGRVARIDMPEGEPVNRSGFTEATSGSISRSLAPGMRALAVRVNLETAAGGFVLPNDRVDVINTYVPSGFNQAISTLVVSNVRVLALDQITQSGPGESLMVDRTATLELDRLGVEAVTAAQQTGTLTLALRSAADADEPVQVPPTISQVLAPGMRAMTIPNIEVAAGAFVMPNDRVDVLHSYVPSGESQAVSAVAVSNARVISIDQIMQADRESGVVVNRTVTLELDQQGAAALTSARVTGSLTLTLRSRADDDQPQSVPSPSVRIRRGGDN